MDITHSPRSISEDSNMDLQDRGQLFPKQNGFRRDLYLERNPSLHISSSTPRSPPLVSPTLRRGSYIEDEDSTLGQYLQTSTTYSDRVGRTQESNARKESKKAPHQKVSSRQTVRRPQIQGPQPQPLQPSMLTPQAVSGRSKSRSPTSPTFSKPLASPPKNPRYTPAQESRIQELSDGRSLNVTSPSSFDNVPLSPPNINYNRDRQTADTSRSILIAFDPYEVYDETPAGTPTPIPDEENRSNTLSPPPRHNMRSMSGGSTPGTAKRAPSSFFSNQSCYASPIPEEMSQTHYKHGSFASSHVIPSSWGSEGPGGFWIPNNNDELMSDDGMSTPRSRNRFNSIKSEEYGDNQPGSTLVRQASVGKSSRAKVLDIQAPIDKFELGSDSVTANIARLGISTHARSTSSLDTFTNTSSSTAHTTPPSVFQSNWKTGHLKSHSGNDLSINSSNHADESSKVEKISFWRRLSKSSTRSSLSVDVVPAPLRTITASPLNRMTPASETEKHTSVIPNGTQRTRPVPPRLNMDLVREAEARGSLTSLPDLIRRATKLAAVLETGRPESRWGPGSGSTSLIGTERSSHNGHQPESISDVLNAFPPPALGYSGPRSARMSAAWPLPQDLHKPNEHANDDGVKRTRKLCGLPLWAFIVLVLLALAVITAAIVVPLQLSALSKDNKSNSLTAAVCANRLPCQNGGLSVVTNDGKCSCECAGEFSGEICTVASDPTCTTFSYGGGLSASIGNSIPRLLTIAGPTYRVPLNSTTLIDVFNAQNISCSVQNALVTLEGQSTRSDTSGTISSSTSASKTVNKRATTVTDSFASATSTNSFAVDGDAVDFSRVAVLYLAQVKSLDDAETARTKLQSTFDAGVDYGPVDIGDGAKVDLSNRKIEIGSSTVGGPLSRRRLARQYVRHGGMLR